MRNGSTVRTVDTLLNCLKDFRIFSVDQFGNGSGITPERPAPDDDGRRKDVGRLVGFDADLRLSRQKPQRLGVKIFENSYENNLKHQKHKFHKFYINIEDLMLVFA